MNQDRVAQSFRRGLASYGRAAQVQKDGTTRLLDLFALVSTQTRFARTLEFGCGTGSTALLHAPHAGRYRATDIAPEMIAIAREKLAAGGPHNVEFAVETLADRAADGPVWDAVLALNILHLLEDPEGACRTAFDILKPGGVLVASTVTLGDRMAFARPLIWCLQMLGKAPRLNYVTGPQVEGWIKAAGFEIEDSWRPKGVAIFTIARKPG